MTRPRSKPTEGARVPPHSLQAEESLLGAALLSVTALEVVATRTRPEDFYKPAHGHIAAVLTQAYEQGWPADPVTVSDALERAGQLEGIGGPAALITLQAGCPASGNAGRYATIVHDLATLRRLIGAAGDIGAIGYDGGDAHEAVEAAHALLENVAANNGQREYSSIDVADIAALLAGDLEPEEPVLLRRTDGQALLYAGKIHVLQGEPTAGKGWVALSACLEVVAMGGTAIYLDREDSSRGIIGRLVTLGAEPAAMSERFTYLRPDGGMGPAEMKHLRDVVAKVNPDIIVIDSVAEFMAADGLDADDDGETINWIAKLPRMLARLGITVVLIDHVVKDPEKQGRWARGSGAKLGAIDGAAYHVKAMVGFSRQKSGKLKLTIAKDREGGVGAQGETAAIIHVEPKADGARLLLRIERDTGDVATDDRWKPTVLMAKCSLEVERSTVPLSASTLKNLVGSDKPSLVTRAIACLLKEGYLVETKVGRSKVLKLVKAYHGEGTVRPEEEPPEPDLFDQYGEGEF